MSDCDFSEILSSLIYNYRGKREIKINTDYAEIWWMLCAIPHILKDVFDNSFADYMNQVKTVVKNVLNGLSDDKDDVSIDVFWSDYTDFDHKNIPFDGDKLICRSKDICDGDINL